MKQKPLVSVVVPSLNSGYSIDKCLASIFSSKYPSDLFEVILVDGGSTDGTIEIARQRGAKIVQGGRTPGEARNIGVHASSGEIIAFTDSDCIVGEDWLDIISDDLRSPEIAGVGGPVLSFPERSTISSCIALLLESFLGSAGMRNTMKSEKKQLVFHNPPANSAIKRVFFDIVGGFDPSLKVSEDIDFDARIIRKGYSLLYDPRMTVWHLRRRSMRSFVQQMFGYGQGRLIVFFRHHTMPIWPYFCALFFAGGVLVSVPLFLFVPYARLLLEFGWTLYISVVGLSSFHIALKNRRLKYFPMLVTLAVVEHFVLGAGSLMGVLRVIREELRQDRT